jgi:hypothetical protein
MEGMLWWLLIIGIELQVLQPCLVVQKIELIRLLHLSTFRATPLPPPSRSCTIPAR